MSSIGNQFSQPVTRNFVVTQNANNGEQGAYYFTEDDVNTWYAANSSKINKLGNTFYIIPGTGSGSTFVDVLVGNGGATELGGGGG